MQIICMVRQYLPYSGFEWLRKKEIDEFDLSKISENSPI